MKATLLFRCGALLAHDGVPAVHGMGADPYSLPGVPAVVETGAAMMTELVGREWARECGSPKRDEVVGFTTVPARNTNTTYFIERSTKT